jgi:hypothetical protein
MEKAAVAVVVVVVICYSPLEPKKPPHHPSFE